MIADPMHADPGALVLPIKKGRHHWRFGFPPGLRQVHPPPDLTSAILPESTESASCIRTRPLQYRHGSVNIQQYICGEWSHPIQ